MLLVVDVGFVVGSQIEEGAQKESWHTLVSFLDYQGIAILQLSEARLATFYFP